MFELLNEDLEDCIDILRQMNACETKNEQLRILAEHRISKKDIKMTVDLCEILVYHYNKLEEQDDR